MELIIVLAIVGVIIAFLVFQRKKELVTTDNTNSSLPVVEPNKEQQATDISVSVPEVKSLPAYPADDGPLSEKQMEQIAQVMNAPLTAATPAAPVAETPVAVVKEKKPRKPRAPKTVQLGTDGQPVATKRKPRSKKA